MDRRFIYGPQIHLWTTPVPGPPIILDDDDSCYGDLWDVGCGAGANPYNVDSWPLEPNVRSEDAARPTVHVVGIGCGAGANSYNVDSWPLEPNVRLGGCFLRRTRTILLCREEDEEETQQLLCREQDVEVSYKNVCALTFHGKRCEDLFLCHVLSTTCFVVFSDLVFISGFRQQVLEAGAVRSAHPRSGRG